jgi:hypothetical protein
MRLAPHNAMGEGLPCIGGTTRKQFLLNLLAPDIITATIDGGSRQRSG